ncbi:MAG TPA: IclR family transcriptional regulator C-terminal domain-containing protein, partial [Nocardioidaceae bacterium]
DETVRGLLRPPLAPLTSRTITDWEDLAADLAAIRSRGYAVDDGETAEGLRCFAVALPNAGAQRFLPPTDAVSVSVPAFRLDEQAEAALVETLLQQVSRLAGLVSS